MMTTQQTYLATITHKAFVSNGSDEETALGAAWLSATCTDDDLWIRMLNSLRRHERKAASRGVASAS